MSNFDRIISHVLDNEGGFVDHPDDPGGATKYGITSRTYPHLDIRNLTKADAREIYLRDWWNPSGLDQLNNIALAYKIFDLSINTGQSRAKKLVLAALEEIGA